MRYENIATTAVYDWRTNNGAFTNAALDVIEAGYRIDYAVSANDLNTLVEFLNDDCYVVREMAATAIEENYK